MLDAIKKRGHFEDYDKAAWKYQEASKAIAPARAGLSLLEKSIKKASKAKKKQKERSKEGEKAKEGNDVTPKAPAKAPEPKTPAKAAESMAAAQEAEVAPAADDQMKAYFLSDLEKAKQAQRIAMGAKHIAASKMFAFYLNLLSPESKYAWSKIVSEQTESNPYINLQGESAARPRGNVASVVPRLRDVSPSHRVSDQCG